MHYYPYLLVTLDVDRVDEPAHDCQSDWCCRPDSRGTLNSVSVSIGKSTAPGDPVPDFVEPGAHVYVLVEEYSDGDTFGNDEGIFREEGVYRSWAQADEASKTARRSDHFFGSHTQWHIHEVIVD